jgi:preprotein translocase subunit YajC
MAALELALPRLPVDIATPAATLIADTQGTESLPAAAPGPNDPAEGSRPPSGGGGLSSFLPFIVIGVVFWFLIIAPERKNRRKREVMLSELKKGDKVMTTGGLYGRVSELRDDIVFLDTGDVC